MGRQGKKLVLKFLSTFSSKCAMTGVLIEPQLFTNSDIHTGEGNMRYTHTILCIPHVARALTHAHVQ